MRRFLDRHRINRPRFHYIYYIIGPHVLTCRAKHKREKQRNENDDETRRKDWIHFSPLPLPSPTTKNKDACCHSRPPYLDAPRRCHLRLDAPSISSATCVVTPGNKPPDADAANASNISDISPNISPEYCTTITTTVS